MFGASTAYGYHQPATFGTTPPSTLVGPNTWSSRMRTPPMTVCKYKLLYYVCTVAHACLIVMPATVPQLILRSVSSFSGSAMALRCPDAIPSSSHSLSHVLSIHTGFPFPVAFSLSLSLSLSRSSSLVTCQSSRVRIVSFALLPLSLVPRPSSIVNRQSFCLVLVSSRLVSSRLVCSSPSLSISLSLSFSSLPPLSLFFSFFLSFPLRPFRSPLISGAHRGTPPDIGLGSGHGRRSLLA